MRIREPLTITCRNISKRRETLVNQGFPAHKKITVPTAPMSVKTVIVSARSGFEPRIYTQKRLEMEVLHSVLASVTQGVTPDMKSLNYYKHTTYLALYY